VCQVIIVALVHVPPTSLLPATEDEGHYNCVHEPVSLFDPHAA